MSRIAMTLPVEPDFFGSSKTDGAGAIIGMGVSFGTCDAVSTAGVEVAFDSIVSSIRGRRISRKEKRNSPAAKAAGLFRAKCYFLSVYIFRARSKATFAAAAFSHSPTVTSLFWSCL